LEGKGIAPLHYKYCHWNTKPPTLTRYSYQPTVLPVRSMRGSSARHYYILYSLPNILETIRPELKIFIIQFYKYFDAWKEEFLLALLGESGQYGKLGSYF